MRNYFSFKKAGYLLLFCVSLYACSKDMVITQDIGYNYFPVKVGKYVVYDVDSILYDRFKHDTTVYKYQIKEQIDSVITDNSGRSTLKIIRYIKKFSDTLSYDSMPWKLKDVWMANRTETTVEQVEENIRLVKLIFPVRQDKIWNGNAYNFNESIDYQYTDVDVSDKYGNLYFDSTLFVTQINNENAIEKQYYVEVYARNVGMIYKQIIDVSDTTILPGVPVVNRIVEGIQYKMTIHSYGND